MNFLNRASRIQPLSCLCGFAAPLCAPISSGLREKSALCLILFLAVMFAQVGLATDATVKSVQGRVEAAAPGSKEMAPIREGQKLAPGTTIVSSANGEAVILTSPGAAIHVQPSSRLVLQLNEFSSENGKITNRKTVVDLQDGTLSALISKNDPKTTRFEVRTPQGVAAARGTFFGVTVQGDEAFVAVKEGKVGVQQPEKEKPNPAKPDEKKRAEKQDLRAAR